MSKNRLEQVLQDEAENRIYPFFWMHGEDHRILEEELEKVRSCGIKGICIEARPHPDFGGTSWWNDMDFIMKYARDNKMKIWLLDDDRFPTGHANGTFQKKNKEFSNLFLTSWATDVVGPLKQAGVPVCSVLEETETLLAAVLVKRTNSNNSDLDLNYCKDVTELIVNGWLQIDIPDGLYRIILFYTTHQGNGKLDYFNILDSESVNLLIKEVYEPHYEHYGDEFGNTFEGFFSDEPEFGNLPGYDFQARLGKNMKYIPWSFELYERLYHRWGDKFATNLPALWYYSGEITGEIRYEYMDEVTKQLKCSFSDQIQEWCRKHGVIHIGHIIEDDNAHGRLGCSTGHYFRTMSSFDMAGIDVVLLQVMPGMDQETHQWVASDRDGEFFHYGLGKLGSSMAHINPKQKGRAMCEIFGAYGWQEGVSQMKWLTDHMLVRGINYFVPHAFSPKKYPDVDCPPHFYAGGNHVQYPYFQQLMLYMNRVSHLLSGGEYQATTAVIYHSDAEWAEESAMLFQKPLRSLMENQIEADIIPCDVFDENGGYQVSYKNNLEVGTQKYECVVIPACSFLPKHTINGLKKWMDNGGKVLCVERTAEMDTEFYEKVEIVTLEELPKRVSQLTNPVITVCGADRTMRIFTYKNDFGTAVFCFNESVNDKQQCTLKWNGNLQVWAVCYDAIKNRCVCSVPVSLGDEVPIVLELGEAKLYIFSNKQINSEVEIKWKDESKLTGLWKIYEWKHKTQERVLIKTGGKEVLCDLNPLLAEHRFNGTIVYRTEVVRESAGVVRIKIQEPVDVCELIINEEVQGKLIGSPYVTEVRLERGINVIEIHFPVTPVYESGDAWSALTVLKPFGLQEEPWIAEEDI